MITFDRLLNRTFVVKRIAPAVDELGEPILDDYSQPVPGVVATFATVRGRLEGRSAPERTNAAQAGVVIGDYRAWMRPLPGLVAADWIEVDGKRYDILSITDYVGGVDHHLELELKAVT